MLDMRAAIADLLNEIGTNYGTKESIGDFVGALGAALEAGTAALYMGITSDTVYIEIKEQGRSSARRSQGPRRQPSVPTLGSDRR